MIIHPPYSKAPHPLSYASEKVSLAYMDLGSLVYASAQATVCSFFAGQCYWALGYHSAFEVCLGERWRWIGT